MLSTGNLTGESGPGHNSFVIAENSDLLIVYHARPAAHAYKSCGTYHTDPLYDPCRHTHIKRVHFDANGDPVISLSAAAELDPQYRRITATITVR